MPAPVARYMQSGAPVSALKRDLVTVGNQVPRVGWALISVGASWVAYRRWKARKQK
jgi:hypothetical protein